MNNKFTRLISFLLILASLVSCFAVFSFAAEGEGEGEGENADSSVRVIINRDFDDGWGIANGVTISNEGGHDFTIEKEELADYSYNYFAQI